MARTIQSTSSPAIVSHAFSQLLIGPAHEIGVPRLNTRSPVNTARADGTSTMESLLVWAGPRSRTTTSRPPTESVSSASNVWSGARPAISVKSKSPNAQPANAMFSFRPSSRAGGTSVISSAQATVA